MGYIHTKRYWNTSGLSIQLSGGTGVTITGTGTVIDPYIIGLL